MAESLYVKTDTKNLISLHMEKLMARNKKEYPKDP